MQNIKKLYVYQRSYRLSIFVIKLIEGFKNYRLRDQLFGAITSIPANLAEMGGYDTLGYNLNKIRIALGEANEAEFWMDLCE